MKQIIPFILFLFLNTLFSQQKKYEVFNTSINSEYAELGVTYYKNNTVLFASSKKNKDDILFKKDRRQHNRQLYLELYKGIITKNGDITQISKLTNQIKTKFFQSDISFTPNYKTVYFTWNNFYNTRTRKDSAKWKTLRIVKASLTENFEITNITQLPFNSDTYSVRSPEVSKDGKQLFFVSDMPSGYGKSDIYVVTINSDGTYGNPKNLGENINTKHEELFPFIAKDSTLYFSSYGHKGKGNLDIFKSIYKNGSYQKSVNLPSPINSKFDDFAFVIDTKTNSGFFTSNRDIGIGDVDIYAFKPKMEPCIQNISGMFFNKNTGKQLHNLMVTIYSNNKSIESKNIQSNYNFTLKCNTNYTIIAEKENFNSATININTTNNRDTSLLKNIELIPVVQCNQTISGLLFNKNTGKQLDNVQVSLYYKNKLQEMQTIGKGYAYNFELKCNETYKITATKENFKTTTIEINTNNTPNFKIPKTLTLTPKKCTQLITGIILDKQTNKQLFNATAVIFKGTHLLDTLKVNANATFTYKMECNIQYRIIASLKNYNNDVSIIHTSNTPDKNLHRIFLLEPNIEFITIGKQKMIKTKSIGFDLDKSEIRVDAAIELDRVIAILKKYASIKIEIKLHTDSRAPDNYNMNLSNRRAQATINYIISKEIDPSRVSGKGYGETQLLNKCSNGIKCTQAEHEINRRTEFVIIEE